jgi:hypothetical protein
MNDIIQSNYILTRAIDWIRVALMTHTPDQLLDNCMQQMFTNQRYLTDEQYAIQMEIIMFLQTAQTD